MAVLYRKYRPKTFEEVIGQEHVVKTLTNSLSSNVFSHAYLFSGPRGSGKTTIARLLAKALNCKDRHGFEPCNKCISCLGINEGKSLDLIEIDAASHRGIDDVKELREGIKFPPSNSKYKIFIIDECHQLSKDAANALLKTLEEPPSHAIFILATTELHKMIPTIISRCQRFNFRMLTLNEVMKRLELLVKKEKADVEKDALELIALNSSGSLRDAESLLDQILSYSDGVKIKAEDIKNLLNLVETSLVIKFVDSLVEKKGKEALQFIGNLVEEGRDLQEFVKALINYLRQALILKTTKDVKLITGLTDAEFEKLKAQIEMFKEEELLKALNLFLQAGNTMKMSPIPQLPLEIAAIEVISSS